MSAQGKWRVGEAWLDRDRVVWGGGGDREMMTCVDAAVARAVVAAHNAQCEAEPVAPGQAKAPPTQRVSAYLVEIYAGILDPLPGDDPLTPWETRCRNLALDLRDTRSALAAAHERMREMAEALEPFAKAGELFQPLPPDSFVECVYAPAAGEAYNLNGNHLRRAARVLADYRKGNADG